MHGNGYSWVIGNSSACRYSPNELRYLPLNTALFEPPLDPELPALDSEPDSDDAEDGKDVKKNKNASVRYISSWPLEGEKATPGVEYSVAV
jgi:hypothetical protein